MGNLMGTPAGPGCSRFAHETCRHRQEQTGTAARWDYPKVPGDGLISGRLSTTWNGAQMTHPEVPGAYRGSSFSAACTAAAASSRLGAVPLRTAGPSSVITHR
jgi:hypothetical protein